MASLGDKELTAQEAAKLDELLRKKFGKGLGWVEEIVSPSGRTPIYKQNDTAVPKLGGLDRNVEEAIERLRGAAAAMPLARDIFAALGQRVSINNPAFPEICEGVLYWMLNSYNSLTCWVYLCREYGEEPVKDKNTARDDLRRFDFSVDVSQVTGEDTKKRGK